MNTRRRYVLSLLLGVYMIHHLDRQVVTLLLVPIGQEFNLSDSALGLLAGTVYAIAFAIAGVPLGMLADRINRVRLLSALVAVWSGLTALCALAQSFLALLLMRIGIGAAESGGTPTNLSLLSDYFDRKSRSTAVGIYMMGPHLGTILGFALAGIIAAHYGWRAAFLAAGVPGVLLALLLLTTVREPGRGAADAAAGSAAEPVNAPPLREAMRLLWSNKALVHLIAGLTIANVVAAGVTVWLPALLMRNHGASVQSAGLSIAFGVATFAALASFFSGMLAGKVGARKLDDVPRISALAAIVTIPCIVYGAMTNIYAAVVVAFALKTVAHVLVNTPGYSLTLSLAPAQIRGTTMALMQVLSNLFSYGLGPQLIGLMSDALQPYAGEDSLRYAIAAFVFINAWAAWHLLRAAGWLRRDLAASPDATTTAAAAYQEN